MTCPTREEYEEALESKKYLDDVIRIAYKRRDILINELCSAQKSLDMYKESLDYQKEIINKYEIYQEISSHCE